MTVELLEMAESLAQEAERFKSNHGDELKAVMDAATILQQSWRGSNLGYHAFVYYEELQPRPPGAQFSAEWGLQDMSFTRMGSRGAWREYPPEAVKRALYENAGNPDLTTAERDSAVLARTVEDSRDNLVSELSVALDAGTDDFLCKLRDEAAAIRLTDAHSLSRALLPHGQVM